MGNLQIREHNPLSENQVHEDDQDQLIETHQ